MDWTKAGSCWEAGGFSDFFLIEQWGLCFHPLEIQLVSKERTRHPSANQDREKEAPQAPFNLSVNVKTDLPSVPKGGSLLPPLPSLASAFDFTGHLTPPELQGHLAWNCTLRGTAL